MTVLAISWLSTPALADDGVERRPTKAAIEEAQRHYTRGIELFKNAIYDAALIEFKRAYEIAPSYKIQYNIGQVSRQLDDYASAVAAYQRFLSEGGSNIPSARQAEVKSELERIEQWVGRLEITSTSSEVEIVVDDVVVGRTPLAPLLINAGRRKVTATMAGRPPLTRVVDVAGGEAVKLTFDFAENTAQTPTKPITESPVAKRPLRRAAPTSRRMPPERATTEAGETASHTNGAAWILWGGTAVLAVGAIGVGAWALKTSNDLDDVKRSPAANIDAYDDLHSKMTRLGVIADVLGGLAVMTGGVALYMTLRPSAATHEVGLVVGPNGAWLRHTF